MKEQVYNPMLEMAEEAVKRCEEVFRTGMKLQEESMQRLFMGYCLSEWQKAFAGMTGMTGMADSVMPSMQKQREDMLGLMTRNTKMFADYFMKAAHTQAPAGSRSQGDWMEMAKRSMESIQSNAEALTEMRSKAIDSWAECVKANMKSAIPRA